MFPAEPAPTKKGKKGRKSAPAGDDDQNKDLPEPVDVLTDAIIGFLEKGTAYLRAAANQAFALLSGAVTASTIDLILTVRSQPPSSSTELVFACFARPARGPWSRPVLEQPRFRGGVRSCSLSPLR